MGFLESDHFDTTCFRERPGDLDYRLLARKLDDRYIYTRFKNLPIIQLKVLAAGTLNTTGGGAATGAAGDENRMLFPEAYFEYHILGTQTILYPQKAANGLDCAMDLTDNDGVELTNGIEPGMSCAFTVGTDLAFFFKCKFDIADVSGSDDCMAGFRKREAYQANVDDYDEMAGLNVISGDIKIETVLNNAATVTTDSTDNWADAAAKTLGTFVSSTGVVTYTIDGKAPTTTAAYTFDDAEVVIPFHFFLHATTSPGAHVLREWECGLQA